ncbi:MAG: hypothetical protein ACREVG_15965 [Burkholderiales bacterium]
MHPHEALKQALYDHCLGPGNPGGSLESTGILGRLWVDEYLALLEQASATWREQPLWPREVVAAIHAASSCLSAKYRNWHLWTAGVNAETERQLAQVRVAGERFLLACAARPAEIG